ncbi:MAG: TIGR02285 family protein [Deltaproteobacteria bacterium]|nr:TIGR02285 family protein [Deltaproteobacteria bacterium]
MNMYGRMIAALAILLFSWPVIPWAQSEHREPVTWLILDLPPFFITKGPDKGEGLADQIQKMVEERLDGYRFHRRVANAARIAKELNGDNRVCFAGEFYGNPEFLTSAPTIALLPHTLVVRGQDVQRFGGGKTVRLRRLLQDPQMVLGTARGRLYGPPLDAVLKEYANAENIYHRAGKDTLEGLLGMLLKGRVDYLIEYPVSIKYAAKKAGVLDRIETLPLKENSDCPPVRGAIRCPDTPWGRNMIREINQILIELRDLPAYRQIVKNWAVPPGRERQYWELYEEEVLQIKE